MSDPTNPIYQHAPEEYFPAAPALDVARAIRANGAMAPDRAFAQHPGLDPNQEGQKGITFLFWAYAHHHAKMLKALVAHGADPNRPLHLPSERGGTDATHLLNIAAGEPKDELLVVLLDLGANPNAVDEGREPALHNAMYAPETPL